MPKFSHRVLHFAIRKLSAINKEIERNEQQKSEADWLSRFNSSGYFDHVLDGGVTIRLYQDSALSKLIFEGFENEELDFLRLFLKKGDTFLDIGANIGLFSLIASTKIGAEGRILAFEPSPKTFSRLQENLLLNEMNNSEAFNIGLSNAEGVLQLNVSENGFDAWNSFVDTKDGKFQVTTEAKVLKLDDVIRDKDVKNVALVKLDVEGWEKYVLQGGETFFKNHSPVVMVEFTETNTFAAGYHVQELYDILEGWGYKWYRFTNGSLIPEIKSLHYPYDNLFAIKDLSYVNARIG